MHAMFVFTHALSQAYSPNLQLIRAAVCSCYLTKESMFRKSRNLYPCNISITTTDYTTQPKKSFRFLAQIRPKYRLFYVMNDTNGQFILIGVGTRFVLFAYYT